VTVYVEMLVPSSTWATITKGGVELYGVRKRVLLLISSYVGVSAANGW
jgi:hypothetical protein